MADHTEVETLLENVEQFINDEKKIVTYEFLSQTCGIHVNLAKTILEKYAEKIKKGKNFTSYQVVYSVCGYVGKNLKSMLVKENNLERAKSKLDKVLSVHVYSVQHGELLNFGLLYNSNLTELKKSIQQCSGKAGIHCSEVKIKSPTELTSRTACEVKKVVEPPKPIQPINVRKDESNSATSLKTENQNAVAQTTEENAKEKPPSKTTEKKPVGKQAIASLFAKQKAKEPVEKKTAVLEEIPKSTTNKRVVPEPSDDETENKNLNKNPTSTKRLRLYEEPEKPAKTQPAKKTKSKQSQKKENKKISTKTQRKRIQQFSDSESSGEEEEEDHDVIISSPERPEQPGPMSEDEDFLNASVVEPSNNLKRSRKMVCKTYMDKDGFIVTNKEFETCEENAALDPPPNIKESAKPEIVPKDQVPDKRPSPTSGKTKQKSITSFFTRK